jgi:hypothetical protein
MGLDCSGRVVDLELNDSPAIRIPYCYDRASSALCRRNLLNTALIAWAWARFGQCDGESIAQMEWGVEAMCV